MNVRGTSLSLSLANSLPDSLGGSSALVLQGLTCPVCGREQVMSAKVSCIRCRLRGTGGQRAEGWTIPDPVDPWVGGWDGTRGEANIQFRRISVRTSTRGGGGEGPRDSRWASSALFPGGPRPLVISSRLCPRPHTRTAGAEEVRGTVEPQS